MKALLVVVVLCVCSAFAIDCDRALLKARKETEDGLKKLYAGTPLADNLPRIEATVVYSKYTPCYLKKAAADCNAESACCWSAENGQCGLPYASEPKRNCRAVQALYTRAKKEFSINENQAECEKSGFCERAPFKFVDSNQKTGYKGCCYSTSRKKCIGYELMDGAAMFAEGSLASSSSSSQPAQAPNALAPSAAPQ